MLWLVNFTYMRVIYESPMTNYDAGISLNLVKILPDDPPNKRNPLIS